MFSSFERPSKEDSGMRGMRSAWQDGEFREVASGCMATQGCMPVSLRAQEETHEPRSGRIVRH
eukprot:760575-Hanusia_phi.AAC.5